MAGGGTGYPLWARCSKCRRRGTHNGWGLTLTGRVQERHTGRGNQRCLPYGFRAEYTCKDCGHVGWSRHIDLLEKSGNGPLLKAISARRDAGSYPINPLPEEKPLCDAKNAAT